MKLQGKVRASVERPGEAGPAPPGWRSHPKSGANSQPNECPFESVGKGLSGAENRFELSLLFVEKSGFEIFFAIFCHFFNFSVYCRGYRSRSQSQVNSFRRYNYPNRSPSRPTDYRSRSRTPSQNRQQNRINQVDVKSTNDKDSTKFEIHTCQITEIANTITPYS